MSGAAAAQDSPAGAAQSAAFRYAVVDLATATNMRPVIERLLPSAAVTLFAQGQPRALLQVGPWLIRLSKAPEAVAVLEEYGDRVPWGFHVHSTFDILSLRTSLRRFNLVRLRPGQKDVLFRYWDPRVMRVFLDVATVDQQEKLFELIERIEIGMQRFDAPGRDTFPR